MKYKLQENAESMILSNIAPCKTKKKPLKSTDFRGFCVSLTKKMQAKNFVAQGKITFPEETNSVLSSHPMPVAFSFAGDVYKT